MKAILRMVIVLAIFAFPAFAGGTIGSLQLFPANNPWNWDVSRHSVAPNSTTVINEILKAENQEPLGSMQDQLHPDFGTTGGIPWTTVTNGTMVSINILYTSESDPGPYPFPDDNPVEGPTGDGDHHIICLDKGRMKLYETYTAGLRAAFYYPGPPKYWNVDCGAIFDITSNTLRPDGWTSSDAAGLAVLPGLNRYEDIQNGIVKHSIRCTFHYTPRKYIYPATHYASRRPQDYTNYNLPMFGMKFRLKASVDFAAKGLGTQAKIVAQGLKTYGMIVADGGGNFFISGEPNAGWDDADINTLKQIKAADFEVVQTVDGSGNPIYPTGGTTSTVTSSSTNPLANIKAYPNSFNPALTTVKIANVPSTSGLTMKVFGTAGELIREIKEDIMWDGKNTAGTVVPNGIYFVNLTDASGNTKTIRVALTK